MFRQIGRLLGQGHQFRAGAGQQRRDRQLAADGVHFGHVELDGGARLHAQGVAQGVGGDEGVAVAVAADPVAHAEKGRQIGLGKVLPACGKERLDVALQVAIQARELRKKRGAIKRQRVLDFVRHFQLDVAQQPRLPELHHAGAHGVFDVGALLRQTGRVAFDQQSRQRPFGVEHALALHLGGVGGEHRGNERLVEKLQELLPIHAGVLERLQGGAHAVALRRGATLGILLGAAQHMVIFGDIGQNGKVAEGAYHADRLVAAEAAEQLVEGAAVLGVAVAVKLHRELAHGFDDVEHLLPLLLTDQVAQQTPEQADVVEQRCVGIGGVACG